MIEGLLARGVAAVVATDIADEVLEAAAAQFKGDSRLALHKVAVDDNSVLAEEADIVSPCAYGASLNAATIPSIRAHIVCGAANNQLEDPPRDDRALAQAGVCYVPDFVANRMGIVNC